jgi:hypothetical protein
MTPAGVGPKDTQTEVGERDLGSKLGPVPRRVIDPQVVGQQDSFAEKNHAIASFDDLVDFHAVKMRQQPADDLTPSPNDRS